MTNTRFKEAMLQTGCVKIASVHAWKSAPYGNKISDHVIVKIGKISCVYFAS